MSVAVFTATTFHVADDSGTVPALLCFRATDPLHVKVVFSDRNVWTFARDVLRDGLTRRAGIGDYTCWTDDQDRYHISLIGDYNGQPRTATLHCPADDIRGLLIDAEDLVPYGAERIDFDAELAALLRGAR